MVAGALWHSGNSLLLLVGALALFLCAVYLLASVIGQRLEQQTRALHDLLEERFVEPVQALAQNSAAWGQAALELKTTHAAFLAARDEAQVRYEAQMAALFDRHEKALQELLQTMRQDQARFVSELLDHLQEQFTAWQQGQAATIQSLLTLGIQQFGAAMTERVAAIESQVAEALESLRQELPEATRASLGAAVSGAVELAEIVREQVGALAQTVDQVSQNADRQVRAYEKWAERMGDWQTCLEQVLAEGQAAQRETVTAWQERAQESLARLEEGFAHAAETAKSGHGVLVDAVHLLADRVRSLSEIVQNLQNEVNGLRPSLTAVGGAFGQMRQPLAEVSTAIAELNASAGSLTKALALIGEAQVRHMQRLDEAQAAVGSLTASFDRMRDAADRVAVALKRTE